MIVIEIIKVIFITLFSCERIYLFDFLKKVGENRNHFGKNKEENKEENSKT